MAPTVLCSQAANSGLLERSGRADIFEARSCAAAVTALELATSFAQKPAASAFSFQSTAFTVIDDSEGDSLPCGVKRTCWVVPCRGAVAIAFTVLELVD